MRRTFAAVLVTACTASALVSTALPAAAGSTASPSYAAAWSSTGSLAAGLGAASRTRLVDQDSYDDKINAHPASPDTVTVGGTTCAYGSVYASGLSVWGAGHNWAGMRVGASIGVRVQVACLSGGVLHRYNWGAERLSNGSWSRTSTNCVVLTRLSSHEFTVSAGGGCAVQDEVLDPKPSKQLSASNGLSMPFEATVTLTGAAPAAAS